MELADQLTDGGAKRAKDTDRDTERQTDRQTYLHAYIHGNTVHHSNLFHTQMHDLYSLEHD